MKETKITDKLKQHRKKKGFTLVELVVVILIIAVLASATFFGGATVIKQARKTKATNDLRNYSSYLEDMFYNHPNYASKGITSGKVVESLNEYLTSDLAVKAGADESKGTSVELKDAWDNAYNYAYYRNSSATEAAVLVWSNGPDQVSDSYLTSIEPTIGEDDIAVLVKMVNGEVSTLTSDSLASGEAGGGSETPTTVKAVVEDGIITSDWNTLKTVSQEIEKDNSVTSATTDLTEKYGLKVGDTKDFTVGAETVTAVIAGFNHDSDNGETGITFVTKNSMNTTSEMNTTATNAGGYTSSYMRGTVLPAILNQMPTDLTNAIKAVTKLSDGGQVDKTIKSTRDNIWLLSYDEVGFADDEYAVDGQGSQYPIFTDSTSRVKTVNGFAGWWSLRSSYTCNNSDFWSVDYSGSSGSNVASREYGVAFGFCI